MTSPLEPQTSRLPVQPSADAVAAGAVSPAGRRVLRRALLAAVAAAALIGALPAGAGAAADPMIQLGLKYAGDGNFGSSLAVTPDGSTAIVGSASGNGGHGEVIVLTRSGAGWVQQAVLLDAACPRSDTGFGTSVAVSADGATVIVGEPNDCEVHQSVGTAHVFTRSGSSWTEQARLTGTGESGAGSFGSGVALSADGSTALVGARTDGRPEYPISEWRGAAFVFTRSGSSWTQQGPKLTQPGNPTGGEFGRSVSLSSSGDTALVGAPQAAGAAWIFTRSGEAWTRQSEPLAVSGFVQEFGVSVSLSSDGRTALVGAPFYETPAGSAWIFSDDGSVWTQQALLTGGGIEGIGGFGQAVALSGDGGTALVGGPLDGPNGNEQDGAAWLFTRSGASWTQQGEKLTGGDERSLEYPRGGFFGSGVALFAEGREALIGAPGDGAGGSMFTFIASPHAPVVATRAASTVGVTEATITGSVDPNGETVSDCHFLYGTTTAYGSSVPCSPNPGSGEGPVAISAQLHGLTQNTKYHYRLFATNASGTNHGQDGLLLTHSYPVQFGRCVAAAKGKSGLFSSSTCTVPATPEKHGFEWLPGPGPKPRFSLNSKPSTPIFLEALGKVRQLSCSHAAGSGEYTGPDSVGGVIIVLTGCQGRAGACASSGAAPGEIVTSALSGKLGVLATSPLGPANNTVGMDLGAGPGSNMIEASCGSDTLRVRGSVIAQAKRNSMRLTTTIAYTESHAAQQYQGFIGGPLESLEASSRGEGFGVAGLKLTLVQSNEEKLEVDSAL